MSDFKIDSEYSSLGIEKFLTCYNLAVFDTPIMIGPMTLDAGENADVHQARLERAKQLGYDAAICTTCNSSHLINKILKKFKWKRVLQFKSAKTGTIKGIWVREL